MGDEADLEMNDIVVRNSFGKETNNNNMKFRDPWVRSATRPTSREDHQLLAAKQGGEEEDRKMSVYHQEPHAGSASFAISVFNLMNAVLGSGILGLAYAMSQLGIVLFFVLMTFVAILCLYAIHLLLVLCEQTKVKAYEKLGFEAFGLPGRILAACCILLQNTGAMCSYLFIVKYELPNVLMTMLQLEENNGAWYLNGDYLVLLVTFCIIMPLATLKNIGFLGYTSGFSIFCMLFFTAVIVAKKFAIACPLFDPAMFEETASNHTSTADVVEATTSAAIGRAVVAATTAIGETNSSHHGLTAEVDELYEMYGEQHCEAKALSLTKKWAYAIPTMTFSFVCHTAVLPIYAELKHPSRGRMQKVSNTSVAICYILYTLAALFGYLTFYNWMEPEMLLMYSYVDANDIMTLVVRLTVLLAVVLTVPLTHYPARKALTYLLFPNQDFKWSHHLGIMMVLLTLINILVIFVPSIREVFGIIGATASTMLVFVLPPTFFLKIDKRPLGSAKKVSAIAMCTIGIGLMIESLTVIIIGYFD